MADALDRFRLDYAPLMLRYLAQQDEAGLQAAYELGREAMRDSVGLLEVVRVHNELFLDVLATARDADEGRDAGTRLEHSADRPHRLLRDVPTGLHGRAPNSRGPGRAVVTRRPSRRAVTRTRAWPARGSTLRGASVPEAGRHLGTL